MDFIKLLRSFEELLFEVLTWLIYYPRTLWLVVRNPLGMMRYSDHEQGDAEAERYTETLSPPFTLLLTVVLAHGVELAEGRAPEVPGTAAMQLLFSSEQNLVLGRALLFGLLPLMAALRFVRARGLPVERRHLRAPFFGQCYLAAPYVLAVSLSVQVAGSAWPGAGWAGAAGILAATAWYLAIQTAQFRRAIPAGPLRAFALALWAYLAALSYVVALALLLVWGA